MSAAPLPLAYESDERRAHGGVAWHLRHDDGRRVTIVNPRLESDEDGTSPTYDAIEVDGRAATDDERDELADDVRDFLRESDWSD